MTYTLSAMHPEDFLSLDEWHALLKAAQLARETALLVLLGGAGLRVSEVAGRKVEHRDPVSVFLSLSQKSHYLLMEPPSKYYCKYLYNQGSN